MDSQLAFMYVKVQTGKVVKVLAKLRKMGLKAEAYSGLPNADILIHIKQKTIREITTLRTDIGKLDGVERAFFNLSF